MQTINVYEFKDLPKDIQQSIYQKTINEIVDAHIEVLTFDFSQDRITEEEYYKYLGCSKQYAETTAWFIPSCYYEHNKSEINKCAREQLANSLFTSNGIFISYID